MVKKTTKLISMLDKTPQDFPSRKSKKLVE